MKKYRIKEIFGPTIQGEGTFAGHTVKFLRFSGCNRWNGLAKYKENSICKFCDTDFVGGEKLSALEIINQLDCLGSTTNTVICTGGEPTIQMDLDLCFALTSAGYKLHLETNGSNNIDDYAHMLQHITMSPKQNRTETALSYCHDLKILFPFIEESVTADDFKSFKADNFYLQPVFEDSYQKNLRDLLIYLYDNPRWALSLQLHKIIGVA